MDHTMTLTVPEQLYRSLIERAKAADQKPESLAIQLLTTATQAGVNDPVEAFIGGFQQPGLRLGGSA